MAKYFFHLSVLITSLMFGCIVASAQGGGAENRTPYGNREEEPPRGAREMVEKMRIQREKKSYDEMIGRGDELARLGSQVDLAFTQRGSLSDEDRNRLEVIERDAKKIRSELGGGNDDDSSDDKERQETPTVPAMIANLKETTAALFDELKRSNRFTVSVPAIEASNQVLRVVRFLLQK